MCVGHTMTPLGEMAAAAPRMGAWLDAQAS